MNVLIALGYLVWIAATLWLAYLPLGLATFLTMDTQNYGVWAVMITSSLSILALSGTGLYLLS